MSFNKILRKSKDAQYQPTLYDHNQNPLQTIFAGGLDRPNRFSVSIPTASLISLPYFKTLGITFLPNLQIRCDVAELPGMNFATSEVRYYGPTVKHAYDLEYPELNLSFILSRNLEEKYFFEAWIYSIQDPITNDLSYYDEYTQDISVFKFDDSGNNIYAVRLINSWPIGIEEIPLDFGEKDTYSKLIVKFAYKKWINIKIDNDGFNNYIPQEPTPFIDSIKPVTT